MKDFLEDSLAERVTAQARRIHELEAEAERLRGALLSIAGKKRPSGEYCQRVAWLALESESPASDS